MKIINYLAAKFIQYSPNWAFVPVYGQFLSKRNGVEIHKAKQGWIVREIAASGLSLLSPTPKFLSVKSADLKNKLERLFSIEPGDTVLDVGSSIGDTTKYMKVRTGNKGKIIAVEPDPTNIKYLRLNLGEFDNVQIIEKAAWNTSGTLQLHTHSTPTGHSLMPHKERKGTVEVQTDTLDNMLKGTKIDFAKIDVQGAEAEVLQGADRLLKTTNKLLVETHFRYDEKLRTYPQILEILKRYGYETNLVMDNGIVYAWRKR